MNEAYAETRINPSDSVRDVATQDGSVLLDIRQGICFSLNPVGNRIWQMLKMNHSVEHITDRLSADFSLPKDQVEQDVTDFIRALQTKKLLTSTGPTAKRKSVHWIRTLLESLTSSTNS